MHGYTRNCGLGCAGGRRRGMGDDGSGEAAYVPESSSLPPIVTTWDRLTIPGPTAGSVLSGSGSGTSPAWETALVNQLGSIGKQLGQMALLPSGSSLLPSGAVISSSGAATGLLTSGSVGGISLTSILLVGGLIFGVMLIAGKK